MRRRGPRVVEQGLCVCACPPSPGPAATGLTPPAPCRWLLWIFPFLIKSHQVGFPSRVTFLPAQYTSNQPCARWWQQSGRSCSTALGCPRPFRERVKGDSGTKEC